jgi:hypothetical protein
MNLSDKQMVFTRNVGRLIEWCFANGYGVTLGEAWRPHWVAEEYQKQGKGIAASLHHERLAIDLNLFKSGEYLTKSEDYSRAGEAWKQLHPMNRWGGDFSTIKDGNHFSMEHGGRR